MTLLAIYAVQLPGVSQVLYHMAIMHTVKPILASLIYMSYIWLLVQDIYRA